MPQNTAPIFPLVPVVTWVAGTAATAGTPGLAANTTTDMTTGTVYGPLLTAGTNGTRVDFVKFRPLGTNVATVARIWINNGLTAATAANNTLFAERTLAATTVSQVAEQPEYMVPMNVSIPSTYRIYVTFGTAVAAGFHVSVAAGDY